MSLPVLILSMAAVYAVGTLLLRRVALRHLVCTRAFLKPAVFAGEESEMIEIVRNDRPVIIPWLRVESRVSPYIRLGRQDNLHISDDTHCCSIFTLMPYQQIRRRHRVKFLHRGEYNLGNASLTAGDLLGLLEANREQEMDVPVLVYPRLLEEGELPAPLAQMMNETVQRRQLMTDPFLFRGIRAYQMGDPVRDIHWPATARTGEAQVRLHDYTAASRLMVIINAEVKNGQWGDRLADDEQDVMEYAISIAATLCMRALESGVSAGFAANMQLGKGGESAYFPPERDAATGEKLLAAFARLHLVRTVRFATFLETLGDCRGMDVIILSCHDSEEIQEGIHRLKRNGCQAGLYLVKGGRA